MTLLRDLKTSYKSLKSAIPVQNKWLIFKATVPRKPVYLESQSGFLSRFHLSSQQIVN